MEPLKYLELDQIDASAEANHVRFGRQKAKQEQLKEDIRAAEEVQVPVEVVHNGDDTYTLVTGFGRYQAVKELNEDGAGLKLPAIVLTGEQAAHALDRQISENYTRADMSPMDLAVTFQRLLDAGKSMTDIQSRFPRSGGTKGQTLEPASPAFVKMHLSFNDLPKAIQEDIHNGVIGVKAAYQITRVDPVKRQSVVAVAKAAREKELKAEETESLKVLKAEKKEINAEQAKKAAADKELALRQAVADTKVAVETATKANAQAQAALAKQLKSSAPTDPKEKEDYRKQERDLQAAAAASVKAVSAAKDAHVKAQDALKAFTDKKKTAAEKAATNKASEKPIGAADIQKAAKAVGAGTGIVPLNLNELRSMIHDLSLHKADPNVQTIGKLLKDCADSQITTKELISALTVALKGMNKPVGKLPASKTSAEAPTPEKVKVTTEKRKVKGKE